MVNQHALAFNSREFMTYLLGYGFFCYGFLTFFAFIFVLSTSIRGAVVEFTLFGSSPTTEDSCWMNGLRLNGNLTRHFSIKTQASYGINVGFGSVELDPTPPEPFHKCGISNTTMYLAAGSPVDNRQSMRKLEHFFLQQTFSEIFDFIDSDEDVQKVKRSFKVFNAMAVVLGAALIALTMTLLIPGEYDTSSRRFWFVIKVSTSSGLLLSIGLAFVVFVFIIRKSVSLWGSFEDSYNSEILLTLSEEENSTFIVVSSDFDEEHSKRINDKALCTDINMESTRGDDFIWTQICAEFTGERILRYILTIWHTYFIQLCLEALIFAAAGIYIMYARYKLYVPRVRQPRAAPPAAAAPLNLPAVVVTGANVNDDVTDATAPTVNNDSEAVETAISAPSEAVAKDV